MERLFVLFLAVASSLAAYIWSTRRGVADSSGLYLAARTILECLGTAMVFLAINVVLGTAIILIVRSITPMFVPVYAVASPLLFVLSFLQGFVFQLWWREE